MAQEVKYLSYDGLSYFKDKLDSIYTPRLVHSASGTVGTSGYVKILRLKVTSQYTNTPISFEFRRRDDRVPTNVSIKFLNANSIDPAIDIFNYYGYCSAVYIVKADTSTWDIYIQKSESYDTIYITRFSNVESRITHTFLNEHFNSVPTDYRQVVLAPLGYAAASHTHDYIPISEKVNATGVSHTNYGTNGTYVPNMNFLSYWDGAYNSGHQSNLKYCNRGAFGTIVTKNTGDYAAASHTHNTLAINGIAADTISGSYMGIIQSSSIDAMPSGNWYNVIKILHGNSKGYYTELAQSFTGTEGLYHRRMINGTKSDWRHVLDSTNYTDYCATASHTHSYLPLGGGTLTGTLVSQSIRPTTTNTYNLGSSDYIWKNVYATTFTGSLVAKDIRSLTGVTSDFNERAFSPFFSNVTMPASNWWSGFTSKGWTNDYNSWQLVGFSGTGDASAQDLYWRNWVNDVWNSWKKILDTSNTTYTSTVTSGTSYAYQIGTLKIGDTETVLYGKNTTYTSLKNPYSLTIKGNGTTIDSYDGSAAKTINITPASIGAAASSHNHSASNITSGTLPVSRGGTGLSTITAGHVIIGNGTGALDTAKINSLTNTEIDAVFGELGVTF